LKINSPTISRILSAKYDWLNAATSSWVPKKKTTQSWPEPHMSVYGRLIKIKCLSKRDFAPRATVDRKKKK
jgi:hypothetical protein